MSINVSVIGGSGYGGGEVVRLLLSHPEIELRQVTSRSFLGQPVSLVHPNLRGKTDLRFCDIGDLKKCDLAIVCLPNGKSMEIIDDMVSLANKIIDLGADFRLSEDGWNKWYKSAHLSPKYFSKFVYGIPEIFRNKIRKADFVAGPGCEAITSILSLWPLVKNNLLDSREIIIDAKMGSSQSGRSGSDASHHPERSGVVRSYKPTGHRHTAEIRKVLGEENNFLISATAIEMVRGLLVTIHTFLKNKIDEKGIWKVYRKEYADEPFIRVVKQKQGLFRYPEPKILQGTNYCDIGFEKDSLSDRLVVIGAIDNLCKGTAGNAVQCMNLMYGFEETLGLEFPGLHPI